MISLNFSLAVALYLTAFLALVFIALFFNKKGKDKDLTLEPRFIWFCSICTYTYINTKEDKISTCPRCGSFNKK